MKENITYVKCSLIGWHFRADFRLAPSQWETSLQSNAVSHWLGANLETALHFTHMIGISPWEKSPDVLGVFSPLSYAHYIDINTMKFTFVKNTSPFNVKYHPYIYNIQIIWYSYGISQEKCTRFALVFVDKYRSMLPFSLTVTQLPHSVPQNRVNTACGCEKNLFKWS